MKTDAAGDPDIDPNVKRARLLIDQVSLSFLSFVMYNYILFQNRKKLQLSVLPSD